MAAREFSDGIEDATVTVENSSVSMVAFRHTNNSGYFRILGPPEKVTTPSPGDSGTSITLDESQLTWSEESQGEADTYDVYFGESGSEVIVSSEQDGLTWDIPFPTLGYGVTYGWRIDTTNEFGTTTGDTWTFTTISFAPPVSSGANTMQVIKRLVAAAANKFWYEDI